tara:strand:- start:3651 stop:4070 length:420 start_codon:yes stop_codon:yes gene_type:complete
MKTYKEIKEEIKIKYAKLGEIKKISPKWYRVPVKYGKETYGVKFVIAAVDITKTDRGEWEIAFDEIDDDDRILDKVSGKLRYVYTTLNAAKAFGQDWAFFEINKSRPDPTDYKTDEDKYQDLDVFNTKSKYYKSGMFKV